MVGLRFTGAALVLYLVLCAPQVRAEEAEQIVPPSQGSEQGSEREAPAVYQAAHMNRSTDVSLLVQDAALRWGIDPTYWLRVAWCESRHGLDPNAYLPGSPHIGVFQFGTTTWVWASHAAGLGGSSPYDDHANIEVASWLFVHEGWRHWPVCGQIWRGS